MENEATILNHYNLTTLYPTSWPTEKDESDISDSELSPTPKEAASRRSKSRYSALERVGSDRKSLVPGSERMRNGVENLVQKDEPDPLGGADSVVRVLRERGMNVEDDSRLRMGLAMEGAIHSSASTQTLLQGLEVLSRSIDQKSASLKVLVESNFERFVRAKTTIDNVYAEMRNQGIQSESERPPAHSRVTSKGSNHFRSLSGTGPLSPDRGRDKPLPSDKKKHALTKESEYGVQGIKAPLIEVAVKAEEIWGPALGGREREGALKQAQDSVQTNREVFEVSTSIADCIKRKDYEKLVEAYFRARRYVDDARNTAESSLSSGVPLTDAQIYQIVITGRMWADVEDRLNTFKREVWRKLTNGQSYSVSAAGTNPYDEHMALISILLELGVEDNPIWVWLLSRYDHLKNKISATFERSRVEIEVLRRRLANDKEPSVTQSASHLKNPSHQGPDENVLNIDTPQVLELWELIQISITNLLSTKGGVLGEVADFWDKAQSFIDGKVQRTLPNGIDGGSRKHHRLSTDGVRDLQNGAMELIDMLRENVHAFFAEPPIEDISMLFSPSTPLTPKTPQSAVLSPYSADTRFKFDANNPPPPSPKTGEPWEEFAFWPPHANSLSGVHYLGKILSLVGAAASEMNAVNPSPGSEKLKAFVASARERSARAVCAAWNQDAGMCKYMEDWTRAGDKRDVTKLPCTFSAYEMAVLSGLQKILYVLDAATSRSGASGIVSPPPSKLLQTVRSQFVGSLYKVMTGMVDNAEKGDETLKTDSNSLITDSDSTTTPSRSNRLLLTLSSLRHLSTSTIPALRTHFETLFSITLTDENPQLTSTVTKLSDRLFAAYTAPLSASLHSLILSGIAAPDWMPSTSHPTSVRPYVYEALLRMVEIHTQLSTTTPALLSAVLTYLTTTLSRSFLTALKQRSLYPLPALMQATLDVEFVAQTLKEYVSEEASRVQGEIYEELDRRTDDAARGRLQKELPEMRASLKRLREGMKGALGVLRRGGSRGR
ncbi:MAG: hypothetical protein Q9191_003278 [Dirinaria sp. TL-2023a]